MFKERINWTQKQLEFPEADGQHVAVWAYEQKRSFNLAARLLSSRGDPISMESVRTMMHKLGHEIYLKQGQKRAASPPKKKKWKRYESEREFKAAYRRRTQGDKKYYCQICGKDAYPNRFYCPTCHSAISSHRGMVDAWGGEIVSNGRYRGV